MIQKKRLTNDTRRYEVCASKNKLFLFPLLRSFPSWWSLRRRRRRRRRRTTPLPPSCSSSSPGESSRRRKKAANRRGKIHVLALPHARKERRSFNKDFPAFQSLKLLAFAAGRQNCMIEVSREIKRPTSCCTCKLNQLRRGGFCCHVLLPTVQIVKAGT